MWILVKIDRRIFVKMRECTSVGEGGSTEACWENLGHHFLMSSGNDGHPQVIWGKWERPKEMYRTSPSCQVQPRIISFIAFNCLGLSVERVFQAMAILQRGRYVHWLFKLPFLVIVSQNHPTQAYLQSCNIIYIVLNVTHVAKSQMAFSKNGIMIQSD